MRPGNVGRAKESRDDIPTLSWAEVTVLVEQHKAKAFELRVYVDIEGEKDFEGLGSKEVAKKIAASMWGISGYRWK